MILLLCAAALCVAAPLAGVLAAGGEIAPYLHFPPRTLPVAHAPFSWTAFALLSLPALAALLLMATALARAPRDSASTSSARAFPAWGWLGLALVAVGWMLAWTPGLVAEAWRRQTFSVLWLGYIVAVNAVTYRRSGHAPIVDRPARFAALFPASAAFWWLFEYLNQFTVNWYYTGVVAAGDWDYFLQATLPFSTVLPAIASTQALLGTWPRIALASLPALRGRRTLAWIALGAGLAALAGLGVWPDYLFPAMWLAPLAIVAGLQALVSREPYFAPLARGDWRCVVEPAAAALVCGFFWELWNYGALAKWHYSIPFVQRLHLFEMPLLGYAGYLPFGVLCALVVELAAPRRTT